MWVYPDKTEILDLWARTMHLINKEPAGLQVAISFFYNARNVSNKKFGEFRLNSAALVSFYVRLHDLVEEFREKDSWLDEQLRHHGL